MKQKGDKPRFQNNQTLLGGSINVKEKQEEKNKKPQGI